MDPELLVGIVTAGFINRKPGKDTMLFAVAHSIHPDWSSIGRAEAEVKTTSSLFAEKRVFAGKEAKKGVLVGRDLRGWYLNLATHGGSGSLEKTRLVFSLCVGYSAGY